MKIHVVLAVFLFMHLGAYPQSPWVRSKGGIYSQLSYQTLPTYKQVFDASGKFVDLERKQSENAIVFYGEYGLTRKTTLVTALPFRTVKNGDPVSNTVVPTYKDGKISGFGNVSLALRHNFFSKNVSISGTLKADFPANKSDAQLGLQTGYNAFTLTPMLNIGMGFRKAYCFGYAGYMLRGNDYSGNLLAGIEAGYHLKKLWLITYSELVQPLTKGDIALPTVYSKTYSYINKQSYLSIGFKGLYEINRFWGLNLALGGAPLAKNLPATPYIGFGVWFKWE